ncbi:hypothetical protein [Bradyrhizobium sp. UNPA324]|uniref:hypothetical protein n=1 Tax=Bradyrhizobium sp. UNPA324 TaxID=1141174 RepID=UPI00114D6CA9|nr:hypothetical protein [Bradyrhizobium sp. UNPA324]TQF33574.1 hypothetical protein UNPA324_31645 [Bradyrhizobium sp. UNPA324]
MPHFVVSFLKDLVGDQGQVCEVCQRAIEIDADDELEAAQLAKEEFCELHAVRDWSLHADRLDVQPVDFPS